MNTPRNPRLRPGQASIQAAFIAALGTLAAQAATTLNGAEFYSNETVKYGRWEIRMQAAVTPGSVSSFFTYYNNSYLGAPEPWREIDLEFLGKNGKGFQSNLITGDAASRKTSEVFHASDADLSQGFHTYVLDWTPDSIVYRMDGRTLRKTPGSDPQVMELTDKAQSYRMNLWASTSTGWVGALDPSKLPVAQTVNWIAYSGYTPGQGPGGSDFTHRWTDDFNTLDTQRWARGNWTFDGNMADLIPANAVVSGGYLMLILSRKDWNGSMQPPRDPQGDTYTTPIAPRRAMLARRFDARSGWPRYDAGDRFATVVAATLDGRIVARRSGTGILRFDGLPGGPMLLRSSEGARVLKLR